jgi:hypothetical protein
VGRRRWQGKCIAGLIKYKYCLHIYVSAKMIPVETIPGMWGGQGEQWRR